MLKGQILYVPRINFLLRLWNEMFVKDISVAKNQMRNAIAIYQIKKVIII